MRRVVVGLLLALALVPLAAQRPARPPTFEPGDTDGTPTSRAASDRPSPGARWRRTTTPCWDYPPQGCVQHAQMWRELDWTKVAALVTR